MRFRRIIIVLLFAFSPLLWQSCSTVKKKEKPEERLKTRTGYKSELMKNLKKDESKAVIPTKISDDVIRLEDVIEDDDHGISFDNNNGPHEELPLEKKPFYEAMLSKEEQNQQIDVQLNFDNAPLIEDVIPLFAEPSVLNFSYLIDPSLQSANVTIYANTKMRKKEIWELFEHMLWSAGAYCSYKDGIVYIQPLDRMVKERRLMVNKGQQLNVEVRLFNIRFTKSQNIAAQIKPFLTDGAQAINVPAQNQIFVVESPANMGKIYELIKLLDTNERANWPRVAIYCENISAAVIKKELVGILPILGYPVTVGKATAAPGSIHLSSVDRLRVIIASAANYESLEELKRWVNILDRDDIGEQERVYVYKVVNNTADDLLKGISAIFNVKSTALAAPTKEKSGGKTATLTTKGSKRAQIMRKALRKSKKDRVVSVFETPMKIFSDGKHNRLIIRTTPRTYAMLKALLKRMDTIPAQVLLQVMIAEIILTDGAEYGMEYHGKTPVRIKSSDYTNQYGTNWGDGNNASLRRVNSDGALVPQNGFNYYIFKDNDPSKYLYLKAFAGRGKVKILSSPQIMAISHTKAQVKVGDKVPIAVSQVNSASSTSELKQEIQYYDTGVILFLTPHITEGGRIAIDLDQTVSQAVKTETSDINSPTIQERKFITTLSLRNKSTIIVGGLISEQKEERKSSAPILIDIPIVSNLLGLNTIKTRRIELLVLITATIIDEKTDLQEQVLRYKNAVRSIENMEQRAER